MIGELIESVEFDQDDISSLAFEIRSLLNSKRQFAVCFEGGVATLSFPKTGPRNFRSPQPQPPQTLALAA